MISFVTNGEPLPVVNCWNSDLAVLNSLDIKMTVQLLGNESECYGKVWLDKRTNCERLNCHEWRTIACCQLLDATEVAMTQNSEKSENFHFVPYELGDGKRVYVKKQESKPIAFAMYKHNKNENDMRRRYGELFWIYATQRG